MPNRGWVYREQVGGAAAGQTVLGWLSRRHAHSTAATWRGRIDAGEVRLEGRRADPDERLRPGQWLEWHRPPWDEPRVPTSVALLYRDAALLALAKPRGLPTLPGAGFLENTLLEAARRLHPEAAPVHRLGRGTSGLVLLATDAGARRRLAAAWRERGVVKVYRALVAGRPPASLDIDTPIGPVPHPRLGRVHAASSSGRPARSSVRRLETRAEQSLVEVRIETGRPHQIRIHLAAAGHPLVDDPVYSAGGLPRADAGLPGDPGYHLHAWRLVLEHPVSGRPLELECPPPPPLRTESESLRSGLSRSGG